MQEICYYIKTKIINLMQKPTNCLVNIGKVWIKTVNGEEDGKMQIISHIAPKNYLGTEDNMKEKLALIKGQDRYDGKEIRR